MKNLIGYVCFLLCLSSSLTAGEKNEYNVNNIPSGLRVESNVVIRKQINEFHVINERKMIYYITQAFTIFGKDEQDRGEFILPYNRTFSEIDYIEGYIYDASGKEIKELDSDEIKDYTDFTSYSLYTDYRIKTASLHHNIFPYTVEFRYRISYNGKLNWPSWYSRSGSPPVQLSRFIVKHPAGEELRYWCNSDTLKPVIKKDGSYKIYTWEAVNQPEFPVDAVSMDKPKYYAGYVITAPGDFIMDGHKGSMRTWKDFGLWDYKLASTQGELSKEAIEEIKKQFNENDDAHEKIRKLYRYMQSRTRYVSIQLGIGGWQPFKASFVHEKGYGDCKALSNYMTAILGVAGITAYQVLIESGSDPDCITEFCSNQFNHQIVCVPLPQDTVWLECTDPTSPYNHAGWHIENRMALMLLPDGGKIVYTPSSSTLDNLQSGRSEVSILKNGSAEADMKVLWTGNQRDHIYNSIVSAPASERIARIINSMKVPDIKIKDVSFEGEQTFTKELTMNLKAELPRYASLSGNRLFFKPNLTEQRTYIPMDVKRLSPYTFNYPFADTDTIIYHIPENYIVEALPAEVNLKTSFGTYRAKCQSDDDKIIYTRYYEINDYEIPAELYSEYRKFVSDIVKADRAQVVLVVKK
jgi:transglutaminase-like putative cysteine protease